ncbi:MAG: hypothetical protein IJH47_03500 [Oscillospiraceae bacterium]|nr:hypothetical protein [Oscillospiraceae bacterium]
MSEEKKIEQLADDSLEKVSGGYTKELVAAYACIRGDYGNGADRVNALRRAGLDPNVVQSLVNSVLDKNEPVARDVIAGKYGVGAAREAALRKAGYDPYSVQLLVNHMLWN